MTRDEISKGKPRSARPASFIALALIALIVCALALYIGAAPIWSAHLDDWIGWARTAVTWTLIFIFGVALLVAGLTGAIVALLPAKAAATPQPATTHQNAATTTPDVSESFAVSCPVLAQTQAVQSSAPFDAMPALPENVIMVNKAPHPAFDTVPSWTPASLEGHAQDFASRSFDDKVALSETRSPASPDVRADEPSPDPETDIQRATDTALSLWPDTTRVIAADELKSRLTTLYHDPAPDSAHAFRLIKGGDLNAAAQVLQNHAQSLVNTGQRHAAEVWRIIGALHMGRDDARAMHAYEQVSALDPADGDVHLYLVRRYQMAGDTAKLPVVLARALAATSDSETRIELLTSYAGLMLQAGDAHAADVALTELTSLQDALVRLRPDDLFTRSAFAVTVARLAQVREMQGDARRAGPLYRQAHLLFSDLVARKPDHQGLRAMADKAAQDAARFS